MQVQQRYILSLMGFGAIFNAYTMRVCLNLALPYMVNKENETHDENKYDWSDNEQGVVLGSFFYGYIITHVPGALLCNYFGAKYVLCVGILSTALCTLLTPLIIQTFGLYGLIIFRIFIGLGEGTTFPALTSLLASWVPERERARLGSLVFGGGQIGTIVGFAVSGHLGGAIGFEWPFYFFGALAIVWCILFVILCYSSPEEHPFITKTEIEYLRNELVDLKRRDKLPPIPWKAILTSIPVIALILAQIGHDWGFYVMVTNFPMYLKGVHGSDVKENGLFAAMPFLVMWLATIGGGILCDYLIQNKFLNITNARKWFTGVAAMIPGILFLCAVYAGSDIGWIITLFTIAMGFMGFWYPGMKVNPLDVSPNYAATITAISNGISAICGAVAPSVIGGILTLHKKGAQSAEAWQIIFWVTFGIFLITTVAYTLWASGEVQPWNDPSVPETLPKTNDEADEVMTFVEGGEVTDDEKNK